MIGILVITGTRNNFSFLVMIPLPKPSSTKDPPKKTLSFLQNMTGFFPCLKCPICVINASWPRKFISFESTSTREVFPIKEFITCTSRYVIYIVCCPCGLQYIGHTKRMLITRLKEQMANICKGFPGHSLSSHYAQCHNRDPHGTVFIGIEQFQANWRGSHMAREISKLETRWIYRARTFTPYGLNVEWDVNAFIANS